MSTQAATGYCTRTLKGDSEWVRRVALSDDGEMLASCGNDQSVKVPDVHTKYGYNDFCCNLFISPPYRPGFIHQVFVHTPCRLAASAPESLPRLRHTVGFGIPASASVFAHPSFWSFNFLLWASRTQVWSVHGGQCLHELREHTHVVESVAFAPESAERTLSTAGSAGSEAGGLSKPRANGSGGAGGAGMAWEEEGGEGVGRGRFIASGSRDKTVKLWNASVGQCLMTFVSAAQRSPPARPPAPPFMSALYAALAFVSITWTLS